MQRHFVFRVEIDIFPIRRRLFDTEGRQRFVLVSAPAEQPAGDGDQFFLRASSSSRRNASKSSPAAAG